MNELVHVMDGYTPIIWSMRFQQHKNEINDVNRMNKEIRKNTNNKGPWIKIKRQIGITIRDIFSCTRKTNLLKEENFSASSLRIRSLMVLPNIVIGLFISLFTKK